MLSSNPAFAIFAAVFGIGVFMFAAGTVLVRRTREGPPPETIQMLEPIEGSAKEEPWTADLSGAREWPSRDLRLDMIERLAMIGESWSTATLELASRQDPDGVVRDAAENALIVIAARR